MGSCFVTDHSNNGENNRCLLDTFERMLIYGYIRKDFDKKCLIDEIIQTIIQFYMTKGGSLYMFGSGVDGCLGIERYDHDMCKMPTLCPPFADNNAYEVSAACNHSLILDTDGNVWCCGKGFINEDYDNYLVIPTKLNLDKRVISVSAGGNYSLLLCDNGWVQSFGMNNFGQIGHGDLEKLLVPKTIEKLMKYKIVQICAGSSHSAALTEEGVLFCFGINWYGECGVGEETGALVKIPTIIKLDDKVACFECGTDHTLLISRKDWIYSFGRSNYGQLGHGDKNSKYTPTLIEYFKRLRKRIKTCAAGSAHSLCIDEEGMIWSFGSNDSGQCGLSEDIEEQTTPKMIKWFIANKIKAKECAAGGDQSSVIAVDGSLYVFGAYMYNNKQHALALQEQKNYFRPIKLSLPQNMTVDKVSMGVKHTAVICNAMH